MAKQFEIKNVRLQDLTNVIGSLEPQEVIDCRPDLRVKGVAWTQKLIEELEEALGDFSETYFEYYDAMQEKQQEIQEDVAEEEDMSMQELQQQFRVNQELKQEVSDRMDEFSEKKKEELDYEELCNEKKTVKIHADKRYELLKDLFEEYGPQKFNSTEAAAAVYTSVWEDASTL